MNPLYILSKKLVLSWLLVVVITLALFSRASAQAALEPPQRWLFIFDTSPPMKLRLPAITAELKNLFITSFTGQLRTGDSIGVWTFNRKINAGEFPLATWSPQLAANISSNIISYLGQQHYAGDTTFAALKPTLSRVIDNSERLTIIIFCDGDDTLKLTPYDDGINQAFKQAKTEREKSKQPIVLVIRTQRGEFVGSTINLPPGILDLPTFPLLPLSAPVQAALTNPPPIVGVTPPPVPVVSLPPLVIVGTNVGTNIDDLPKIVPTQRVIVTNQLPATIATKVTTINSNEIVATISSNPPSTVPIHTANSPVTENVQPTSAAIIVPQTPVAAASTINVTNVGDNNGDSGTRNLILIGIGLLTAAIVLVFFLMLQRPRTSRESLITSSMQNDPHPPTKK